MKRIKKKIQEMGRNGKENQIWKKCGSLTIEASLGLSLFVFAVVCLIMPLKMLDTQRKIQMVLESFSKELSQYAYIQYRMINGMEYGAEKQLQAGTAAAEAAGENAVEMKGPLEEPEEITETVVSLFARGAAELYLREKIREAAGEKAVTKLNFSRMELSADGEQIDLQISYGMKLPFSIFTLDSVPALSRSLRRGWIGSEGGRRGGQEGTGEDEIMVYVGKTMSKYHWFSDCHYISNDISSISIDAAGEKLSSGGARYKPCSVCGKNIPPGATVYILPNGKYYHSDQNCSSLAFYVRKVPLTEVEYLGECSYCRRKREGK